MINLAKSALVQDNFWVCHWLYAIVKINLEYTSNIFLPKLATFIYKTVMQNHNLNYHRMHIYVCFWKCTSIFLTTPIYIKYLTT